MLDQPILERMIADHHQPAALTQNADCLAQYFFQVLQLAIDRNPKRLEGPCGRVNSSRGHSGETLYGVDQV
jgi:hypothetical protein